MDIDPRALLKGPYTYYMLKEAIGSDFMEINQRIMALSSEDVAQKNELIEAYIPFIIGKVSATTKRYIEKENDEEFLVGLEAFSEAIDRYNDERGNFLGFAERVIRSRVTDWMRKQKRQTEQVDYTDVLEVADRHSLEDEYILKDELFRCKKKLAIFGVSFDDLADEAPKHKKTMKKVTALSRAAAKEKSVTDQLYKTRKLPMALMISLLQATRKVLKRHRNFIVTVIVIIHEEYRLINQYLLAPEKR